MLLEHLFIFLPGFFFLSGIGLFSWVLSKKASNKRKGLSPRDKANLKAVLKSVSKPVEDISIAKFNNFSRFSVIPGVSDQPLAGNVYPESIQIPTGAIKDEFNKFFDNFDKDSKQHIKLLRTIEEKIEHISGNNTNLIDEQIAVISQEKNRFTEQLSSLSGKMDEALREKENVLAELIARYEYGHAKLKKLEDGSAHTRNNQSEVLHTLLTGVRIARRESFERFEKFNKERKIIENRLQETLTDKKNTLVKIQHEAELTHEHLQFEIETFQKNIQEIETSLPKIINEKEEQISQMQSAVHLLEARLKNEDAMVSDQLRRYAKHMEYRIRRATDLVNEQKDRNDRKFALYNKEIEDLQQKTQIEEIGTIRTIQEKEKEYDLEKNELHAQKNETTRRFFDISAETKQKLAECEQEIAVLKETFTEKEYELKRSMQEWDQKRNAEKKRLTDILAELKEAFHLEQTDHAKAQVSYDQRIASIQLESKECLRRLSGEGNARIDALKNENIRLRDYIAAEQKRMAFNLHTWNEHEQQLVREKQAAIEMIDELKKNMIHEQEKQHAEHVLETTDLNQQIKELEEQVKSTQAECVAIIQKHDWEIECLTIKEKRNEEQTKEQWHARETAFSTEKDSLEQELEGLNSQMARSAESAEKKRQELIISIKALRKDLSHKREFADSLMRQREREYKKMIMPLHTKIERLRETLITDKRKHEANVLDCNDKIQTLKLRLAWRDERQQASDIRRQKEIEKFRYQLNEEIDDLRKRSQKLSNKQDRVLSPFIHDFGKLSQELSMTEERLDAEKNAYSELKKSRIELEAEISQIEDQLPYDMEQYIKLLNLKSKEIKALDHEVSTKERQIDTEEIISREAMQRLRKTSKDIRLEVNKIDLKIKEVTSDKN